MGRHLEPLGAAAPGASAPGEAAVAPAGPQLRPGAGGQGEGPGAQGGCEAHGPCDAEPGGGWGRQVGGI